MADREATDAEMLAAVERWARATGRWWQDSGRIPDGWSFTVWAIGTARVRFRAGKRDVTEQTVDPHTALLWALLVEAGITVDVGRCQRCHGDGHTTLTVGLFGSLTPDPCKGCNGTARDIREAAMLVLAAAPPIEAETAAEAEARLDQLKIAARKARAFARDALHVEADRMLPDLEGKRPHDPDRERLGEWLALWLAGKREGTAEAVVALRSRCPLADELAKRYREAQARELESRILLGDPTRLTPN